MTHLLREPRDRIRRRLSLVLEALECPHLVRGRVGVGVRGRARVRVRARVGVRVRARARARARVKVRVDAIGVAHHARERAGRSDGLG